MSNVIDQDQKLWEDSTTPLDSYSIWSFSSDMFYIGSKEFKLSTVDHNRAAFELGLFDIYFIFRQSSSTTDKDRQCYFYHTRLRSAVEAYFNNASDKCISRALILEPWLCRTFCACSHSQDGRNDFLELSTKHCLSINGSDGLINMSRRSLHVCSVL
jgi:hypothetical protein